MRFFKEWDQLVFLLTFTVTGMVWIAALLSLLEHY